MPRSMPPRGWIWDMKIAPTFSAEQFHGEVYPTELEEIRRRRDDLGVPVDALDDVTYGVPADGAVKASEPGGRLARIWSRRVDKHLPISGPVEPSARFGLAGLALSGGGIRSASFCLGVLQVLARRRLLERLDYISSVSGGGYIASTLTTLLATPFNDDRGPTPSADNPRLPVEHRKGVAESAIFKHLRGFSKYLTPGRPLEQIQLPTLLMTGIALNLMLLLPVVGVAASLTALIGGVKIVAVEGMSLGEYTATRLPYTKAIGAVAAIVVLALLLVERFQPTARLLRRARAQAWNAGRAAKQAWYRLSKTPVPEPEPRPEIGSKLEVRATLEQLRVLVLMAFVVCLFVGMQPWFISHMRTFTNWLSEHSLEYRYLYMSTLAAALGAVPLARRFATDARKQSNRVALYGLAITGPLLLWSSYLWLTKFLIFDGDVLDPDGPVDWISNNVGVVLMPVARYVEFVSDSIGGSVPAQLAARLEAAPWATAVLALSAVMFVIGVLMLDVNQTSLHGFYRDRLSRAFLFYYDEHHDAIVQDREYRGMPPPDELKLSEIRQKGSRAPYHLLNGTVNLQACRDQEIRHRRSDFFVFSKHFVGGPKVGYCRTREMERRDPALDLGTAMAVSGAAASPNRGAQTVRAMTFVLTALNVRLGYWLPNPLWVRTRGQGWRRFLPVKVGPRYFFLELLGWLSPQTRYLNVSDGGHIENLGLYELLRRRCKYIIVVDAEYDPNYRFPALARAMRFARIDFAYEIDIDLSDVRPDANGNSSTHWAAGTIDYGDGETGTLIYLKLSVSGDEGVMVAEYRKREPRFPHQPTTQQSFTEAQFESYRALGHHVASEVFDRSSEGGGLEECIESAAAEQRQQRQQMAHAAQAT